MRRTYSNTDAVALGGLAAMIIATVAVIAFFAFFLLPFIGQLQAGLAPLLAMAR